MGAGWLLLMIILGSLAGYFLTLSVLIFITMVVVIVGITLSIKLEEMAGLAAVAYNVCGLIALVCMWGAHYRVTQQTWIGDFVRNHLLR